LQIFRFAHQTIAPKMTYGSRLERALKCSIAPITTAIHSF